LFGDEYERTVAETAVMVDEEGDSETYPIYTYDYMQSSVWHAKLNHLFSLLDLKAKVGSVLYNLSEFQIQYLLAKLDPRLLKFQLSCWWSDAEDTWCNECSKCTRIAFMCGALNIPLPEGLKPFDPALATNGRACFAVTCGCEADPAAHGADISGIGPFLDQCYTAGVNKLKGDPFEPVDRLRKIQPEDPIHPHITLAWHDRLNSLLADHPLGKV
jgi:hypothetical protein